MLAGFFHKAHGNGGLDDHDRLGVDGHHILNHRPNRAGVEVIGDGVVICRGGDDDEVRPSVGFLLVQRGAQFERFVGQVICSSVS